MYCIINGLRKAKLSHYFVLTGSCICQCEQHKSICALGKVYRRTCLSCNQDKPIDRPQRNLPEQYQRREFLAFGMTSSYTVANYAKRPNPSRFWRFPSGSVGASEYRKSKNDNCTFIHVDDPLYARR
ncbi:hypothetical protein BaRGS_00026160 [Batillaria attramentaria]|uniref:Uncharacterized protein n=1 Tax=Batillaria attramentaria TaxID=370345 RepID=A0ABD0K5L8_9CAEN